MAAKSLFDELSNLKRAGKAVEALHLLRNALRRGDVEPEDLDRAGRIIVRELPGLSGEIESLRLVILGQCTTTWLRYALTAVSWGRGLAVDVSEGAYDNVMQELEKLESSKRKPDLLVLLPWHQRLLSESERPQSDRCEGELAFWKGVWHQASNLGIDRIVQVGYDWVLPGAKGFHFGCLAGGDVAVVREVNDSLRRDMPKSMYFVPLEEIAGTVGRARFYDQRGYYWTKQPFSEAGTALLAEHIFAGMRALTTGPKKVLVVDLDNTLWGGIVGEQGPLGVSLGDTPEGEAFRSFQRYLKELSQRGVLLAVASKNNPEDAREAFKSNPDMVLSIADFAAFEANWLPKYQNLQVIASTLNLGLDSFVFCDDNAAEREEIRQFLPEVEVVEMPADPSEYVPALQAGLWFETIGITDEDLQRSTQYVAEGKRRALVQSVGSVDTFLRSLEMRATSVAIGATNLPRVIQLLAKTNQFNLTVRRHSEDQVLRLLALKGAFGLAVRLWDRFGDCGLVALAIAVPDEKQTDALRIDSFLMSCRVIGRTVEHHLMSLLCSEARRLGYRVVIGEYFPTLKNTQVRDFYPSLGFRRVSCEEREPIQFELELANASIPPSFVRCDDRAADGGSSIEEFRGINR